MRAGLARLERPMELVLKVLDEARRTIRAAAPGYNVLRYLLLRMQNQGFMIGD